MSLVEAVVVVGSEVVVSAVVLELALMLLPFFQAAATVVVWLAVASEQVSLGARMIIRLRLLTTKSHSSMRFPSGTVLEGLAHCLPGLARHHRLWKGPRRWPEKDWSVKRKVH
jgi:hypothetical protein